MPFCRLVEQVMATAPYRQARRVFWIVDNGLPAPRRGKPFEWTFTRDALTKLLEKLGSPPLADAA